MARYLLIEVDSNATAERLRAQIDAADEAKGMRVVGMFTRATQLCECDPSTYERTIGNAIVTKLGAKFGWHLCPACLKPRPGSHHNLYNLLDNRRGTREAYNVVHIGICWIRDAAGRVRTSVGSNNKEG